MHCKFRTSVQIFYPIHAHHRNRYVVAQAIDLHMAWLSRRITCDIAVAIAFPQVCSKTCHCAKRAATKPATRMFRETTHTTFWQCEYFDLTGKSSTSYMTAGKYCCCCSFNQSARGRINNTLPSKEPAMNPPRCMKLSMRGNRP